MKGRDKMKRDRLQFWKPKTPRDPERPSYYEYQPRSLHLRVGEYRNAPDLSNSFHSQLQRNINHVLLLKLMFTLIIYIVSINVMVKGNRRWDQTLSGDKHHDLGYLLLLGL